MAEVDGRRRGAWRLADSSSAYLRGAAEQPIEWHPWGSEPFDLAKRSGKPILLDIGAVWCHWCHVMDEGTYADGEVARLIAQQFVAVKVDRDQSPEVDRRYQRQVSALTGQGGWPLTAFLNAEGETFLGGTYFPPQDGMGRPGFRRVLKEIARMYREEPEKIRENARLVQESLTRLAKPPGPAATRTEFVTAVQRQIALSADPVNGGFGHAPKFPHPTAVSLELWASFATGDPTAEAHAHETLLRMADSGMYDHVGGGFHRYATDEAWHIPHFEKMGVDNAALLFAYSEGTRRFGDARLTQTVRGILGWTLEVLADPRGGFGASQDADNAPGDDGGYFTWSRPELKSILTADELKLVSRVFGVGTDGQMPHDPERNVLYRLMDPVEAAAAAGISGNAATTLDQAIGKLRRARAARPTPVIDRALYADINGGFIRGLVAAARVLGDPVALAVARKTADRFLAEAYDPSQGVAHRLDASGGVGYGHLEDQAQFALGLVELAGATLEPSYVAAAQRLLSLVDREFRGEDGLLRDLSPALYDGPKLGSIDAASYPLEDNPHLSANAAVALGFLRLASLTGDDGWREKSVHLTDALAPRLLAAGLFASGAALAAGLLETAAARVVVTGKGAAAEALARAAERAYHPNVWVFRGTPPVPFSLPEELVARAEYRGEARALVCFGMECRAPITEPAQLAEVLRSGGARAA
ncbi:MAG: thioredoxin domain-containing protein [Thermoplasmata archaeon]|nr:thioredoxin domain-containing protein [Thermoplasmata archaeon]